MGCKGPPPHSSAPWGLQWPCTNLFRVGSAPACRGAVWRVAWQPIFGPNFFASKRSWTLFTIEQCQPGIDKLGCWSLGRYHFSSRWSHYLGRLINQPGFVHPELIFLPQKYSLPQKSSSKQQFNIENSTTAMPVDPLFTTCQGPDCRFQSLWANNMKSLALSTAKCWVWHTGAKMWLWEVPR